MAEYDFNELLRVSAIDVLSRIETLSGDRNFPPFRQDAQRILRTVERQTSSLFYHEPLTHGQIVRALEEARIYSIELMSSDPRPDVMGLAFTVAQLASNRILEIVSHPDYKPPRRYP